MSSVILWYILMVGVGYLEVGLLIALILWSITYNSEERNKVTLKELIFTIMSREIEGWWD